MARNDGVDRTFARNRNLKETNIAHTEEHNEREMSVYRNPDIVAERNFMNVHYKKPIAKYEEMFKQLETDKVISTRGLKQDADHYGELIFDVNSAYFHNHGGYEFAKQFYLDAYHAAIDIVGGKEYILSAVMHADERNRAMSEALGQDIYHYHLHVVYIPTVEKEILWSKRCKDKNLVGTVKEVIRQVSSSKKWNSKPALDEEGQPIIQKNGKPVLRKSYSVLQDDFFQAMKDKGYDDLERGERGSSEEHLTVTQFKVEKEKERLDELQNQVLTNEKKLKRIESVSKIQNQIQARYEEIDHMGKETFTGNVQFTKPEAKKLKKLAKQSIEYKSKMISLNNELEESKKDIVICKRRYEELKKQTKDFIEAIRKAPELVKSFIRKVLHTEKDVPKHQQHKKHERTI